MRHKDVPGSCWPGHNQHDQNLTHYDGMHQHMHFGYAGASDPNQVAYPVDNRFTNQGHIHPNWGHSTVSGGFYHTHHNNGFQHLQLNGVPINHPFPPLPAVSAFPSSRVYPSSSSNINPPGFYWNDPSYNDLRIGGSGSFKRKRFDVPFEGARENTNRSDVAGSSSSGHVQVHPNLLQEKSNLDYTHHCERQAMWTSSSGGGCIPVRDEDDSRNVRRRYGYHVGPVVPGISVPFEHPAIRPSGYFSSLNSNHWTSGGADLNRRYPPVPPAAPIMIPVADFRNSYQGTGSNPAFRGSSAAKFSSNSREHRSHFHGTSGPFDHRNSSENLTRPIQTTHSFSQQFPETNRNPHNASGVGPSRSCPPIVSGNHSSIRHSRPFHCEVPLPTGRNGGPRVFQERRRLLPGAISAPDRSVVSEGFIVLEMFDQHSDMRLDVDNMTYEELIALGERIGNVCTGLTEDGISECLIEVTHHIASDQHKNGENCAICLEEYDKMESVVKLRECGHGYHTACIKKWLSLKNSCPICKASPGVAVINTDNNVR